MHHPSLSHPKKEPPGKTKNPGSYNSYCCLHNSPGPQQLEAAVNIWPALQPGDPIAAQIGSNRGGFCRREAL